ncbi:hypothetical protein HPB51_016120 [Rhipicephalus microplus]|uniref:Uncharacterized protein n=1 Tax=Rhipicephalus microplus TaxID=6941 RepID=A0A9J6DVS5_RHIMP|nr:hypothetical protein HPB51_016120 [Rhipicephalus microplus]
MQQKTTIQGAGGKITEARKKNDMDKMRQLSQRDPKQENAELRTTINNLKKEIAEICKLLLSNNEPPQRPMPSTSKTEKIIMKSQEIALEEPVLSKRAFEAKRKQKRQACA